jgi:hypothetical protein
MENFVDLLYNKETAVLSTKDSSTDKKIEVNLSFDKLNGGEHNMYTTCLAIRDVKSFDLE